MLAAWSWKRHYIAYVIILVVGIINVISYANFSSHVDQTAFGDAASYIKMSQQTFAAVGNPFALRLLTPTLVHELVKLPLLGLNSAWLLVTFVATTAAIMVFFNLLFRYFKLSLFTSTVMAAMLACTYNYTLYNYHNFWLVDPLNNLFYVLAIYFLLRQRLVAFGLVILLGSINKETMLLLVPLYPLLAWMRGHDWRTTTWRRSAVMAVVVSVAYLAFHWWAQHRVGAGAGYQLLSGADGRSVGANIRLSLNSHKQGDQLAIFQVFQFMWLIFVYTLYRLYGRRGIRSELLVVSGFLLVAVMFGRLFATDTERVYVMMAPVVLGLGAILLDAARSEQQRLWVGVMAFLYVALNLGWVAGSYAVLANVGAVVIFIIVLAPSLTAALPGKMDQLQTEVRHG